MAKAKEEPIKEPVKEVAKTQTEQQKLNSELEEAAKEQQDQQGEEKIPGILTEEEQKEDVAQHLDSDNYLWPTDFDNHDKLSELQKGLDFIQGEIDKIKSTLPGQKAKYKDISELEEKWKTHLNEPFNLDKFQTYFPEFLGEGVSGFTKEGSKIKLNY